MTTLPSSLPDSLEALIRSIKSDWTLDLFGVPGQNAAYLNRRLSAADEAARERFSDGSVRLTLETVGLLARESAYKARAFIEQ